MIIKSITLNNFRQYENKQTIEFSTDKERNVTVVLGVNTSGKTTIIQAFSWCLYNKSNFNLKEVINLEVVQRINIFSFEDVYVEICLIHDNKQYIIKRSQRVLKKEYNKLTYEPTKLFVQYKEANGEMQEIINCEDEIEKILPEALSDYFFFDGERISDINSKGDVVAAVRGLMGLDVISEAVDHFKPERSSSVIGKLKKEIDVGKGHRSNKIKDDLIDQKVKLEEYEKRLITVKEEESVYEERKKILSDQIYANKETKSLQVQKSGLELDIKRMEGNTYDLNQRIVKDFSRKAFKFFATPLIRKAIKVISETKNDGVGIPDMHSKAIDYILKRGKCICGCDLTNNKEAVEYIKYERSLLPPQHMGTIIRQYKEMCILNNNDSRDFVEDIRADYIAIRENIKDIDDKKDELKKISSKIIGNIDVGKIEKKYQENEKTISHNSELKQRIAENIGSTKNQIASYDKEIEKLSNVTDKNIHIQKCIEYATDIYSWFNESYIRREKEVKQDLLERVNYIFEQMYHGKRIVTINDKYQINLMTTIGDVEKNTDESKGLEAVKNFAFISGLVDLAKKKVQMPSEDGIEAITEPYPLVMDAPFSNADEIHIAKISKIIPDIAEQIILVVMKKDWDCAKNVLGAKIGAMYEIKKHSETNSSIERMI